MNKLFVFNDTSNIYQDEMETAFMRLTRTEVIERISLSELSISLLKSKQVDVVIADDIPMEWIYTLRGMRIVSLIFGKTQVYHHGADIVVDYKGSDSAKYFSGGSFAMSNSNFNFEEVSSLVYQMKWDSDFFGFPIAFVGSRYLSENIQGSVDNFVKKNNIRLVEYLCNCHDDLSVKVAEKNGFHFTDIRITFTLDVKKYKVSTIENTAVIALAEEKHIPCLKLITHGMYKDSRYFYDGNFELDKINSFYSEWIEKAVLGTFDNECYCVFEGDEPVAFCTIRYNHSDTASIGLFGVGSSFAGKGYGRILLEDVMNRMKGKQLDQITVVTQGRNYSAQRLYQRAGFRTFSTELWYHKWMN